MNGMAIRGRCGGGRIPVAATAEEPHDLAGGLILPLSEKTASETETSLLNTFNFAHYIEYMNKISCRAKLRTSMPLGTDS